MKPLKNKQVATVVDKNGRFVEEIEIRNAPVMELYPQEKFILIQWMGEGDSNRPTEAELAAPVEYNGQKYYGAFGWGSAVKRGQTIGLTHDFPNTDGPVKLVEDGQRVGRWLLGQGIFGGFTAEKLTIGVVQPGTVTRMGPVEDGFGYIKKSLLSRFARKERIHLGGARDNYSFFQRIPWTDDVAAELAPIIHESLIDASDPARMLWASPHSFEQKKELYDLDNGMIEHPYIAASLNRSSQDYYARLASSVSLRGQYRTAVPTTAGTVCWPGNYGKAVIDRSPIDSNGSIQAIQTQKNPKEEKRILAMEVVQVSISSKDFSSKGCLGAVDDRLMDYDIVVCSEDIKMVAGDLKALRKSAEIELTNVVVPFIQVWDGKSLVGVNASWAKNRMGLDHDGDAIRLVDCNDKPALWRAVSALEPGETPKLPKSKRPLKDGDFRANMIAKSMVNLVGFATNVAAGTFMVSDRDWLAKELGLKSEAALNNRVNFFIKVGTDGFKTSVDQAAVSVEVAVMQANLVRMFGNTAPWTAWGKSAWAFKRGLPAIIEKVNKDGTYLVEGKEKPVELSDDELSSAVWPFMDGVIAQIARLALPALRPHWSETVSIRPLSAFRNWAAEPKKDLKDGAKEIQYFYNARVGRVNWTDPKEIQKFKNVLADRVEEWGQSGLDRMKAAQALWWVSHSARSDEAGAACVFLAFPEECKKIVAEKPGLKAQPKAQEVILTGLNYQLPNFKSGELKFEIADITTVKRGKKIIRRVLLGKNEVQPKDRELPRNLIAFVAANCDQPEPE